MSNFKKLLESVINESKISTMITHPNNYSEFQKAMQFHSGKKVIRHNGNEIWSGTGRATHPAETAIKNQFNLTDEPSDSHFEQISIKHYPEEK